MTRCVALLIVCAWGLIAEPAPAQEAPLAYDAAASRIDELLNEEVFSAVPDGAAKLAPRTSDATFLRRVNLDLVGTLPEPAEVTAFALDPSPDKREQMVEQLLTNPHFGQNWARYWRDVIFARRTDDRSLLAMGSVESFMTESFNANVPWSRIATEFVTAEGDIREVGGTALIMAQQADAENVTSEISRILLGVQIQCAQCHDHPTDRWKREQFHQLAAFFPRIEVRPNRSGEQRSFDIVGVDDARPGRGRGAANRATQEHYMPDLNQPEARGTLMQPVFFVTGQTLATGASDYDRRETLAAWITDRDNPWFARAFVNRMWAELVGEGFYEPVDDMGPDRECSAPATMEFLSQQFAAHEYDIRWLFQTIMATQAYQRESRDRRQPDEPPFMANRSQPLRSDQLFDSLMAALDMRRFGPGRGRMRPIGPGVRRQFAEVFGFDPSDRRDEIVVSIPQALYLMNHPSINDALSATRGGVFAGILSQNPDNEDVVVELYLRCLSREPNQDELGECLAYYREAGNRAAATEDIVWALLNRAEFQHRD